jgi:hypothetical protein
MLVPEYIEITYVFQISLLLVILTNEKKHICEYIYNFSIFKDQCDSELYSFYVSQLNFQTSFSMR